MTRPCVINTSFPTAKHSPSEIASRGLVLFSPVVFDDLAKEIFVLLPAEIHQKNDIELIGENIFVKGNRALLGTLIRNLIENASKYSRKNLPIVVTIKESQGSAIIEVSDRGPGMTDEQKVNSVKRRYRVSDTQTYGSGLGLSIAQKVVELYNGRLNFSDQEAGSGLIAIVELPI